MLSDQQLVSWKEIAAYLKRDVRTVQRWERSRGLPLHRLPGGHRRAVYAVRPELDAWLISLPVHEDHDDRRQAAPLTRWVFRALFGILTPLAVVGVVVLVRTPPGATGDDALHAGISRGRCSL